MIKNIKIGDRVACYGFDMNSIADCHNGCRGRVVQISECYDCERKVIPIYGVEFDDLSHGWFIRGQIRKVVKK